MHLTYFTNDLSSHKNNILTGLYGKLWCSCCLGGSVDKLKRKVATYL